MHDASHRAEALVGVEPAAGLDVIAQARGPQGAFIVELFRLDQPLFALFQLGKSAHQFFTWLGDHAVHPGGYVVARSHLDGLHSVHQLADEALGLSDGTHGDDQ